MVVVDAGSHIGQYTVIASQLVKEGTVHAFEPDPITFRQLEENVALNSCRNVSCNCAALSRELGYGSLYLSAVDNIGGNSLRPTGCYAGDQTTVSLQTLDHYAGLVDLARLDVLKADVEGAELFLLEGGEQVISRFHPVVILEFSIHTKAYGYTPKHLEEKLKKWGYLLFKIGPIPLAPLTLSSSDPPYLNVLAVHQEQVEDLLSRKLVHPHGLEPR
jgi:FkbM family methyltransferase